MAAPDANPDVEGRLGEEGAALEAEVTSAGPGRQVGMCMCACMCVHAQGARGFLLHFGKAQVLLTMFRYQHQGSLKESGRQGCVANELKASRLLF